MRQRGQELVHGFLERRRVSIYTYLVCPIEDTGERIPELWVITPRRFTSSPRSCSNRNKAWNAPRALKAPIRWKFSHLKKNRNCGHAGSWPSNGVPTKASEVCGVEAIVLRVVQVNNGVQ